MDKILCVVREWTDGSRRGVGRTIHKMNWTKPLGHGGSPLEDWKVSWRVWQVRLAYGTLSESPQRVAMTLLSPSFPALGHPMPDTCWRSSDLGTHGERADGGPSVYQQTRGPVRTCLTVGERSLTQARAA